MRGLRHRLLTVSAAATAAILIGAPCAMADPGGDQNAKVIVAIDPDADRVSPEALAEAVRTALQNSPEIAVSGGAGQASAHVTNLAAHSGFAAEVRLHFANDPDKVVSETPLVVMHVKLDPIAPPSDMASKFGLSTALPNDMAREVHGLQQYAQMMRPQTTGITVEQTDDGATLRFNNASTAAAWTAVLSREFASTYVLEPRPDGSLHITMNASAPKSFGAGRRLALTAETALVLQQFLREPADLEVHANADGVDISIPNPERNAEYIRRLTAGFKGTAELTFTTEPALDVSVASKRTRANTTREEFIDDPGGSLELMSVMSELTVPAYEAQVDGDGVDVRAHDPAHNDELARYLQASASMLGIHVSRTADGAIRVLDAAPETDPAPHADMAITVVKRRLSGMNLAASNVHPVGSGRVEVDFASTADAKRFAAAQLNQPTFAMRLEDKAGAKDAAHADQFKDHDAPLWLHKEALLTGADVEAVGLTRDMMDRPAIGFKLTPGGTVRFANATLTHVGQRFGIVLNGKLLTAPTIETPITGGTGEITGNYTEAEAREIARQINEAAGADVPLKVVDISPKP